MDRQGITGKQKDGYMSEMESRGKEYYGKEPDYAAEVRFHCERAYRRGFQHGIVALGHAPHSLRSRVSANR